jgi:hypothetical protein
MKTQPENRSSTGDPLVVCHVPVLLTAANLIAMEATPVQLIAFCGRDWKGGR